MVGPLSKNPKPKLTTERENTDEDNCRGYTKCSCKIKLSFIPKNDVHKAETKVNNTPQDVDESDSDESSDVEYLGSYPRVDDAASEPAKRDVKPKYLGECPICLEDFTKKEKVCTACGHVFCVECIKPIIETTKMCPTCRKKTTLNSIHSIYL